MQSRSPSLFRRVRAGAAALLGVLLLMGTDADAARKRRGDRDPEASQDDFVAKRLLKTGQDLLLAGEHERGIDALKRILEQFPDSDVRYDVYLALGKHLLETHKQEEAIGYLRYVRVLDEGGEKLTEEKQELLLEALYLTGVAYFQMRKYSSAFPVLRKITNDFPESTWANQAYYYIGMGHFAQENWSKAIESLSNVGTYVDPDSSGIEYVEAGQRLYVKIHDNDLPILHRLGNEINVSVKTSSGDEEKVRCIPLSSDAQVFVGSAPTEVGVANPGNHVLDVVGGDTIETVYQDGNTQEGERNVRRLSTVTVVSSGSIFLARGDYETRASGAFLGQPIFVVLKDADLDTSTNAETVKIRIIARYKKEEDEEERRNGGEFDLAAFLREEKESDMYEIRDELMLSLTEHGEAPVRTGAFRGRALVQALEEATTADKTDAVLSCVIGDEIVLKYVDELHLNGDTPKEVTVAVKVLGELESTPRATQYVVSDPVVRSKKNLVEATAYLELGRIFKSMGLSDGANEKCNQGIDLVDEIILMRENIPSRLREDAFKLKWELQIVQGDFAGAISTCGTFSKLFPHSPLLDQALMGIGNSKLEEEDYEGAISIYRRIMSLPDSHVKAEASFRVAQAMEKVGATRTGGANKERAIAEYKNVAERFPDSGYAGEALGKLVDYYIESKDYARADDLLEQVFKDHPDAQFLDRMLLKWVIVAYRMGDFPKAHEKCSQLLFEFPTSSMAAQAKKILPNIERKIKK